MAQKEVHYYLYCKLCKHFDIPEIEDPCNECLAVSYNEDSHKPIKFEKDNKKKKEDKNNE